jgi:hypothetical protein
MRSVAAVHLRRSDTRATTDVAARQHPASADL